MNATKFLDTNILLHAYDKDAPAKREIARRLVAEGWAALGGTAVSVQVLQEFHANLEKRGVPRVKIRQLVHDFEKWPVVDHTLAVFQAALTEQTRWKIPLSQALLLAAARASGATELLTEDLNHGQDYGGLRALNPFV